MKKLSIFFGALAILLSDVMCAVVAYHYCDLLWAGRYAGYSAPASMAFVYVIPYAFGIVISVALAIVLGKKPLREV